MREKFELSLAPRDFIEGILTKFSKIAQPLQNLVNQDPDKGVKKRKLTASKPSGSWSWTNACQESFDKLKTALTTAPILGYAGFTQPFVLEVDASHQGLGAVLSQKIGKDTRVCQSWITRIRKKRCDVQQYETGANSVEVGDHGEVSGFFNRSRFHCIY